MDERPGDTGDTGGSGSLGEAEPTSCFVPPPAGPEATSNLDGRNSGVDPRGSEPGDQVGPADYSSADVAEPDPTSAGDLNADPAGSSTPPDWLFPVLMSIGGVAFVLTWIGDAIWADWVTSHPLALMALNSRDRILLLTVNEVERIEFFVVAGLRLIVFDPFFYLLGWFYGDRALAWIRNRGKGASEMVDTFQEVFPYIGYPLLIFVPGVPYYVLAGVGRMNPFGFAFVTVAGTFARLAAIVWLGGTFSSQISTANDAISRFRTPVLIISILSVAWFAWKEIRNSRALRKG